MRWESNCDGSIRRLGSGLPPTGGSFTTHLSMWGRKLTNKNYPSN